MLDQQKSDCSVGIVKLLVFLLLLIGCYKRTVELDFAQHKELSEEYRIALFPLDVLTEKVTSIQDEVEDELTARLLKSNLFVLLERKMVDDIMEEMKLQVSDLVDISTAVEVGKLIGAEYIVVGSISSFKDDVILSVRIVQVETGRIMAISTSRNRFSRVDDIVGESVTEILTGFVTKVE